jgi:NAD-dependent dihydropyrimidine dehydrogenase PreA subunit
MECPSPECLPRAPTLLGRKLSRLRPWVQTAFLGVWLAPLGRWLHAIPGCVFHCYSCPLSSFACPVGVAANYAALLPVCGEVPYLLIGMLLVVGAVSGSLACGWACPFGFLQDGLARIPVPKLRLPAWAGSLRYVVLVGLVLVLPMVLGYRGVPFDDQALSICRVCPAGALEAGVPYSVKSYLAGGGWLMSWFKTAILVAFIGVAVFVHRPWCRLLCPLGGLLALFNRVSLFHLRFNGKECVECNLCRSRCSMGVKVDEAVNVTGCIRCLECTTCGALEPGFALPAKDARPPARPPAQSR